VPYLLRVELPDVPGSLGRVATAIGEAGGDIEAIEIVEHSGEGTAVDDVLLETAPGVMPDSLVAKEVAHRQLRDLRIVSSMHERKALMAELSDAFIALPGGYGTLEEFCEVLTWSQLGIHRKACGLLNTCGYYDGLLALLDHAVAERFLKPVNRGLVLSDTNPERLIERVLEYDVPLVPKWVDRAQA